LYGSLEGRLSTISDVARQAGVSTVTVSRVLNGAHNVNSATRARVEQAIAELGYVPNVAARSLRSKRMHSLALLVPDITNVFWTTVARGVEDAAQSRDYSVLLCNTDENPAKQARYLQVVASQRVDGAIIAPYDGDGQNLAELRRRNIPTVLIDRHVAGWDVDSVLCDSVASARALVRQLIGQGHRRIAAISGPPATSTADDRVAGYSLALREAGLPLDLQLIRRGEFRVAAGERLAAELFATQPAPTAVFAANNAIALGVIQGLEQRGLRVPEDVVLVCIDDLPNADRCFPFLTVVVQPAYDMGASAAELLLSRLQGRAEPAARHVVLPTHMILRGAVPGPAAAGSQQTVLVEPLSAVERQRAAAALAAVSGAVAAGETGSEPV
jgi:LacI family transcriptional regulator